MSRPWGEFAHTALPWLGWPPADDGRGLGAATPPAGKNRRELWADIVRDLNLRRVTFIARWMPGNRVSRHGRKVACFHDAKGLVVFRTRWGSILRAVGGQRQGRSPRQMIGWFCRFSTDTTTGSSARADSPRKLTGSQCRHDPELSLQTLPNGSHGAVIPPL